MPRSASLTTGPGVGRRRRPGAGASAVLLAVAIAALASGCGGASRQHYAAMMAAQQQRVAPAAPGTTTDVPEDGDPGADAVGVRTVAQDVVAVDPNYRVAPGDLLDVKFAYHPEENERVIVRPDGRINLQVVGDVQAAGLGVDDLERVIVEKSSVTLRGPVVSIVVAQMAEHKVYVGGQVAKPGFAVFRHGMTPLQAIVERGGFADDAKLSEVVHIHRGGPAVEARKLDLRDAVDGESADVVALAPNDILIVPRTFIGEADIFVDQWIRGLLPSIPTPGYDLPALFF